MRKKPRNARKRKNRSIFVKEGALGFHRERSPKDSSRLVLTEKSSLGKPGPAQTPRLFGVRVHRA